MKPRLHFFFGSLVAFAMTQATQAADITWDASPSPANNNWSTFDNWSDNLTPTGDDVTFNNTGTASGTTVTNIVDTSYTIDSLRFTQSSTNNHTTSISSGAILTVNGSFVPSSGQATAVMFSKPDGNNTATTNFTGDGTFTVNNASNHFLVGYQNGTQGSRVTVDMSGLANFNATVNIFGVGRKGNVNSDGTRQESGYLYLAKNSTITATAITVGDSNAIDGGLNAGINNGSASTLFLSAGGSRVNNLYADTMVFGRGKATGNLQFASGALASDTVTLRGTNGIANVGSFIIGEKNVATAGNAGGTVDFGTGKVDAKITDLIVGRISANTSSNLASVFSTGTNALSDITVTTASLANRISGTGQNGTQSMTGTLNVQGGVFSATTVNLATGANGTSLTRTATLNVDGGTFRFGSFGTPVGGYAINFNSGGVASIDSTARALALNYNLGKAGGGTTVAFGQASGGTGTIALNGGGTLLGNTTVEIVKDTTLGGAIGGAFSLTKTGAATLIVNQNQNYSGGTTVNNGTLKMSSNKTLASGSNMSVGASGTWSLDGTSQTLGELTGTGLVTSAWVTSGFDTLTVGSADATSTFDGTIVGGNGTSVRGIHLSKNGTGTLTLTGENTYTGTTTVSGGKLVVNGSISNSSLTTVNSGATLAGYGTLGAVSIETGGTLAPGNSAGTMTFNNNLGLNTDSISDFEINGFTSGNYDLALAAAAGSQTVGFNGGTLNLLFSSDFNTAGTVKIFDFDVYSGTGFTIVNSTGLASGYTASFDFTNGIVTVIPEPRAAMLGLLGMLALLRRRRK